jgi:hypothetical protein
MGNPTTTAYYVVTLDLSSEQPLLKINFNPKTRGSYLLSSGVIDSTPDEDLNLMETLRLSSSPQTVLRGLNVSASQGSKITQ